MEKSREILGALSVRIRMKERIEQDGLLRVLTLVLFFVCPFLSYYDLLHTLFFILGSSSRLVIRTKISGSWAHHTDEVGMRY